VKPKPTGARLYKRFMEGASMFQLWCSTSTRVYPLQQDIEDAIRAYLKRRDAGRRSK